MNAYAQTVKQPLPSLYTNRIFRSVLLRAAVHAREYGATDFAVRYNPYLRKRVLAQMDGGDEALTAKILQSARLTRYGAGRSDHLADWPVLEKESLRNSAQDFINPRSFIRIPAGTGGTSGIPLKLWRSLESIAAEQVFLDALLAPHGLSMRSRMAVLRADSVKPTDGTFPPFGRTNHGGKRLVLSSPHLNQQTMGWYHDALTRFAPSILWVYPSAAGNLLALCEQVGLRLSIPVILASSEMLSAPLHRALESGFHSNVINYYGQAERVCFAHSTKPGEFFFDPRYGRVEFSDAKPYSETENAAKIIGTSYWNSVMPLIRYNTGDLLTVPKHYGKQELAEIALGKRPFISIAGRDGEYLVTRDGMRIIGLNQIPREINNILQLQLVQTDFDHVQINVITLPDFNGGDAHDIEEHARSKLPAGIRVTVQQTERLHTATNGKTPLVLRSFREAL